MFEVIICTVSSGRVQRRSFDTWDEAYQCADEWRAKYGGGRYRVELVRHELPAVRTAARLAPSVEAA
jgi:hypothetical protein